MIGLIFLLCLLGTFLALYLFLRADRFPGKRLILFAFLYLIGSVFLLRIAAAVPRRDLPVFGAFVVLIAMAISLFVLVWKLKRKLRRAFLSALPQTCPPIHVLKDLLAERLPSQEQAWVATHLEGCTACQHRIEGLTAGHNSWPDMAHKLSERPPAPEPALRKVMAKLKESDEGATGDEPVFAGDLPLDFLSSTDKPGQLGRLERYEVLEEIGRGGMGIVLKAFDPSLHRVVAIKVLAPQLATSGVARKRFLREAKAAAAVTHDHIVTIHAVDEANGLPYLVMHYVAGMSLQGRIDKEGPLELAEILRIGMQTASGLAAAHGHGIVHRDIKPANILLEDGVQRVKITDFGLARAMDDASLTQSGFVAGSPLYMAPEQARGEALDHRADLFSLGSLLYTMCTGRPPFRAANTLAVLRRVSEDVPRPIRETNPEVPDWLVAVVDKLMAKDPHERYQSAAEVEEVLGQHLAQLQHAKWTPPPPAANAPPVGLPTSVTICPSCGASLHVPDSMVGTLVHCAECGKPFHVEDTSEVIQVARPVQWPLKSHRPRWPRYRVHGRLPGCVMLAGGCAVLLFLLILFIYVSKARSVAQAEVARMQLSRVPGQPPPQAGLPLSPEYWQNTMNGLPPEATLFGTIDFWAARDALDLNDDRTQTLLRLLAPRKTAKMLNAENLGHISFQNIALGYYEKPKTKDAWVIVRLSGTALDGHKRIVEFIRREAGEKVEIEELDKRLAANGPVCISGPKVPFALKIVDDHHAYLAASLSKNPEAFQHRRILEHVPSTAAGYSPPWIKTALKSIPSDACGFFLGEIPDDFQVPLSKYLKLRLFLRTFVLHVRREGDAITLTLNLNPDKTRTDQIDGILREDIAKWRQRALDDLRTQFPALRKETQALAQLEQALNTMSCDLRDGGGVRVQMRISASTWKVVSKLLKRMFPPDEDD